MPRLKVEARASRLPTGSCCCCFTIEAGACLLGRVVYRAGGCSCCCFALGGGGREGGEVDAEEVLDHERGTRH